MLCGGAGGLGSEALPKSFPKPKLRPATTLADSMEFIGIQWNSLEFIGIQWNSLEFIGIHWNPLEFIGIHWNSLEFIGIQENHAR